MTPTNVFGVPDTCGSVISEIRTLDLFNVGSTRITRSLCFWDLGFHILSNWNLNYDKHICMGTHHNQNMYKKGVIKFQIQ